MTDIAGKNFNVLKREGGFITYEIDKEEKFSQIGYKVMKSQESELFIESAKVKYNGNIKLLYAIQGYRTLASICKNETIDTIGYSLHKTINGIRKICENGFLDYENVIISFQNIYFDEILENPYFIYLPLLVNETENRNNEFGNKFSNEIVQYIKNATQLTESQKQVFLSKLGEMPYSLDKISQCCSVYADNKPEDNRKGCIREISIVSMEKEIPLKFVISGEIFTIGRRKDNDGVLDFSKQISRLHCSIMKRNGRYGVIDENSKYGTKLNSIICEPGKFYELCAGDELSLPAITFKVQ